MKGKTGKPSAMRGGGLARKGVGMALKGGGIARKGTGSNATPGGKKMAGGGFAGGGDGGGRGDMGRPKMGRPGMSMGRPFFPSGPRPGGSPSSSPGKPNTTGISAGPMDQLQAQRALEAANYGAGGVRTPGMSAGVSAGPMAPLPAAGVKTPGMATPMRNPATIKFAFPQAYDQYMMDYNSRPMKSGGKVAKYAKGGSVKMTAGAGSGSGRLEKVAAHKAAKRIPATGLKKGGKVKGK